MLAPISEIAGQMTIPIAAHLLRSSSGGSGILLGGTPGVPPARVVILGAGSVGFSAARTAAATGARVAVLDIDPRKLRRVVEHLTGVETCLADEEAIAAAVTAADVVIGAVLVAGTRSPHVVSRAMVESMKPGSAIIDVSIDQGGCVETSRPTTIADPTFSLPRRHAFLRAQLHRGPGTLEQRGHLPGHAAVPAGNRRARRRGRHPGELPSWRAASTRCAGGARDQRLPRAHRHAEQAMAVVRSGQRVYVHNGCCQPEILLRALVGAGRELRDVEIVHMATFGYADYTPAAIPGPLPP